MGLNLHLPSLPPPLGMLILDDSTLDATGLTLPRLRPTQEVTNSFLVHAQFLLRIPCMAAGQRPRPVQVNSQPGASGLGSTHTPGSKALVLSSNSYQCHSRHCS